MFKSNFIQSFLAIWLFCLASAQAQPLKPEWGNELLGTWRVVQMDTTLLPASVDMFLEFLPDKLLMHNQKNIKETAWKVMEGERQILIRSEGNIESWDVRYIDGERLAIYDTLGKTLIHLRRYKGDPRNSKSTVSLKKAAPSDLVGTWLLVTMDNKPIGRMSLSLNITAAGQITVKAGPEKQDSKWELNESQTRISLIAPGLDTVEWLITGVSTNNLSFIDRGVEMGLTRYVEPIGNDRERWMSGKWKIVEVAGAPPAGGSALSRYMVLDRDGKMSFFSNDKKEGEGAWGLNETKDGLYIVNGDDNELWRILSLREDEMLLEIQELKMLLRK